jgi:hypothetical protein
MQRDGRSEGQTRLGQQTPLACELRHQYWSIAALGSLGTGWLFEPTRAQGSNQQVVRACRASPNQVALCKGSPRRPGAPSSACVPALDTPHRPHRGRACAADRKGSSAPSPIWRGCIGKGTTQCRAAGETRPRAPFPAKGAIRPRAARRRTKPARRSSPTRHATAKPPASSLAGR